MYALPDAEVVTKSPKSVAFPKVLIFTVSIFLVTAGLYPPENHAVTLLLNPLGYEVPAVKFPKSTASPVDAISINSITSK